MYNMWHSTIVGQTSWSRYLLSHAYSGTLAATQNTSWHGARVRAMASFLCAPKTWCIIVEWAIQPATSNVTAHWEEHGTREFRLGTHPLSLSDRHLCTPFAS